MTEPIVDDLRPLLWPTAGWLIALGGVVVLGGPDRLGAPAFVVVIGWATALGLPPTAWGWPLLAGGLLLAVGLATERAAPRYAAYTTGAIGTGALAVGLTLAALRDPTASATGAVTYSWTTAHLLVLAFLNARKARSRRHAAR